jgi:hypothetical protein
MSNKVVHFLSRFGRMSRRDICCHLDPDLGFLNIDTLLDIDDAEQDGLIVRCDPTPGGHGVWYKVAK